MKYAKKIQLSANLLHLNKALVVVGRHGTWDGTDKYHVVRKYLPKKQVELVRDALPEILKPHLMGVNYSEILLLAPHIHTEEKTVINFYQHVNGEITSFWEGDIEQDDRWAADNGKGYINVNPDKIKVVESFTAKDGDAWILNTRQPHSVSMDSESLSSGWQYAEQNNNARIIVQAYIDLPYEEAVKCFEEVITT